MTERCAHDPAACCWICSDQVSWWRAARIKAGLPEEPVSRRRVTHGFTPHDNRGTAYDGTREAEIRMPPRILRTLRRIEERAQERREEAHRERRISGARS